MLTSPADMLRRATGRVTGRLSSLPILALSVHSACNCRCVMCDIWKANANKREISIETLQGHLDAIRALGVQRVMLTGGEPLLHTNLWRFCSLLQDEGVALTLVTTGLLLERHAADIREFIDEVVVSIDGWSDTHDAIRHTPGGFTRIARGVATLRDGASRPHVIGRSVVQKANCSEVDATVQAVAAIGVDRLSFLAVDVSSSAFNRPAPWSLERKQEVGLGRDDLPRFADSIRRAEARCRAEFASGFVVGGARSLWRIHDHFAAATGVGNWPRAQCNAPWMSAVLDADGTLRPCFFQPAYASAVEGSRGASDLRSTLNSPQSIAFRRELDVRSNEICRECVCRLSLPLFRRA